MPDSSKATGQSLHFRVKLDGGPDLGNWSKCDGLSVEYDIFEYKEGGENTYVHRIPGRAKFQNLKLTRPVNKDSKQVADWIAQMKTQVKRETAEVSALDTEGNALATWSFEGVYPVRWTGPSLDIGNNQAATETLELAHNGFAAS
jgi:phage tail-like protein